MDDPAVIALRLAEVPRIVVASPKLFGERPFPREPDDLAALPWLALQTFYRNEVALVRKADGVTRRFAIRPRLSTDSLYALRNAILSGLGVGIVSAWMVTDDLEQGRIRHLAPGWEAPRLPVHLVYPYARFYPARLRVFLEAMREALPTIAG
ncbi:LysR substrate-binding domain-containing protein [Polyangium sp. rjm3]|uniref:LysR substrate-binding domain-containing protein n=1 Tax=Polyangium mundeleinium TaxID=2995306 RepID=A0ABT5EFW2_9BACT|nr:LysR substrate-binding domain-containing protein [Polyangium mundeleinium]